MAGFLWSLAIPLLVDIEVVTDFCCIDWLFSQFLQRWYISSTILDELEKSYNLLLIVDVSGH